MEPRSQSEVLIAGAGPVGMVAAASLAAQGVDVQIADRGFRPAARSYALALHPRTLELFDELGIAGEVVEKGHSLQTIAFYDDRGQRAEIRVAELDSPYPFILVLPQSSLEEILEEHLRSRNVRILWNHRVTLDDIGPGQVKARLDSLAEASAGYGLVRTRSATQEASGLRAFFAIGADGYWSAVRQALDVDYQDLGSAQTFGVFEFESDWDGDAEVRVVLTEGTTNVLWPLGNGRFRWSFELDDAGMPPPRLKRRLVMQLGDEAFPYLEQGDLEQLIASRAPWFDATIGEVFWSMAVRFEHRLVESFGRDTAWLAGDAAHLAGPVGAHSMNVGIREACDLGQRILAVLHHGESRQRLSEYGEEQLTEWRRLLDIEGHLTHEPSSDAWVRSNATRIVQAIPAAGEHLDALLGQLGLSV